MSKPNAQQTAQEFQYTLAIKKILHDMELLTVHLNTAKSAGIQGVSAGALRNVEGRMFDLKAACYNALKTV
jgi:hypothetical protein